MNPLCWSLERTIETVVKLHRRSCRHEAASIIGCAIRGDGKDRRNKRWNLESGSTKMWTHSNIKETFVMAGYDDLSRALTLI